ncbi:MAG: peptidoglycan-binding protein [Candidatus Paceibacterota bacterium]
MKQSRGAGVLVATLFLAIILLMPSPSFAASFTQNLSLGSTGAQVLQLQEILTTLGFYTGPQTGYFGQLTKIAVTEFQKAYGLPQVGQVGPQTRATLNGQGGGVAVPTTPSTSSNLALIITRQLSLGATGADVSALQQFLKNLGFYTFPTITGYFGPVTAQAVSAFQSAHGLAPVGEVGPLTRAIIAAMSSSASTGTSGSSNTTTTTTTTSTSGSSSSSDGGGGGHYGPSTSAQTDTTPPVVSSVASSTAQTTAAITWTTDESATSQVEYGTTTSYGSLTTLDSALVTSHNVNITGLSAATDYHYRVRSADSTGNTTTDSDHIFTTTAVPDTTPPARSAGAPSGILALNTTTTTISLTTNEAATCKYSTNSGVTYALMPSTFSTTGGTSHSQNITGLTNGTPYVYYVKCQDLSTNANVNDYAISFSVAADSTVPVVSITAPINNDVVTGNSVSLTATSTDDVSVSGVQFLLDGSNLGSEDTSSPYAITWDTTGSVDGTHALSATARDGAGNVGTSTIVSVRVDNTAPVVSSTTATGITTTGANITWTTNESATSQVIYGATTSYGATTTLADTSPRVTSHTVSLSGLTSSTLYHYRVLSTDSTNHTTVGSDNTFTTSAVVAAPAVTTSAASSITTTSAILNGNITNTNNASSTARGFVYGLTTSYTATTTEAGTFGTGTFATTTSGLTPSTLYHFSAYATNSAGTGFGSDQTFTTSALAAPVISAIASSTSATTATITWTTDQNASSTVNYGTTSAYGTASTSASLVTSHSISLTGLAASTTYHFQVGGANSAGTVSTSSDKTFTTTVAPDVTPPVISAISSGTPDFTIATTTWTTNELSTSQLVYGTTTAYGATTTLDSTLVTSHSVILTGLTASTTYHFMIRSSDAAANLATSSDQTFDTASSTSIAGLYNYNAAYLANWRTARNAAKAGTADALVSYAPGDSTTAGTGTVKSTNVVNDTANKLLALGFPASNEGFYGSHGSVSPSSLDPNLVIGSGWNFITSQLTYSGRLFSQDTATATTTLKYTPYTTVDTWDIYYLLSAGAGTFTVSTNGGAVVATTSEANGSTVMAKMTVTVPSGTQQLVITPISGTGIVYIQGAVGRVAATKQITFINGGIGGATGATWSTNTSAYTARPQLRYLAPKLTIINLTINDWNATTSTSTYTTQIQNLINDGKISGDVLLMSGNPSNPSGYASVSQQQTYIDIIKSLAVSNNCAMIDLTSRWGSYAVKSALTPSWYFDSLHPSATGYNDIATAVAGVLAL